MIAILRSRCLPLAALVLALLASCTRINIHGNPESPSSMPETAALRVATYNVSLYDEDAGGLVRHPDGLLEGASDPRSDGTAACW